MLRRKPVVLLSMFLMAALLLSGCLFGSDKDAALEEIDPPRENYLSEDEIEFQFDEALEEGLTEEERTEGREEDTETEESASAPMVERIVYVFDHAGHVVPLTIKVPHTEGVAKQALEYLVVDGPVTDQLPDGMRAVLPAGTELTVKIEEDRTAVVDFSPEFREYHAGDEKGILEAITYTLTEFEGIDQVKIMINGYVQETMPVNGTPINQPLSRRDGINVEVSAGTSIGDTSAVTLYFLSESPSGRFAYYVPVTRLIPRSDDLVQATVEQFIHGPQMGSGLYSLLSPDFTVLDTYLEQDTAVLRLNQLSGGHFKDDLVGEALPRAALDGLVLSLTEMGEIKQVQVQLDDGDSADLSQPVARPAAVNTASF